jgi:putative sigma-54 modulation protein
MQVTFTARHFRASEPLKDYAEREVTRLEKYNSGILGCDIVLTQERSNHIADITVKTRHARLTVRESTDDFFKSIDQAVDKLERQLKKEKEKFKVRNREKIGEALLASPEEEEAEY